MSIPSNLKAPDDLILWAPPKYWRGWVREQNCRALCRTNPKLLILLLGCKLYPVWQKRPKSHPRANSANSKQWVRMNGWTVPKAADNPTIINRNYSPLSTDLKSNWSGSRADHQRMPGAAPLPTKFLKCLIITPFKNHERASSVSSITDYHQWYLHVACNVQFHLKDYKIFEVPLHTTADIHDAK